MNGFHFAVIGDNISYSKSHQIFEAIFRVVGTTGIFDIRSVSQSALPVCLEEMINNGVIGFSVTIPHKEAIIEYLDEVRPVARTISAVNSVKIQDGKLIGNNTDCYGFSTALKPHTELIAKKPALIFGSGGAAKAVIYALAKDYGVESFVMIARSQNRLKETRQHLESKIESVRITTVLHSGMTPDVINNASLIVNCTPLGGPNHPEASPLPDGFDMGSIDIYYDLNYNTDNLLIKHARDSGIIAIDGSVMLTAQAVRSFEFWTGQTVDLEIVHDSVFKS